jgi:hypothetical protein
VLRAMLAGLLFGAGLAVAPTGHAEPQTCPPVCDRIPASAWIDPTAIPMNSTHRWPHPAVVAAPVSAPRFKFEELCATPPPREDPREWAVAARAVGAGQAGPWRFQAQILHWRGETWRGGEWAVQVFDTAVDALRSCPSAAGYAPTVSTVGGERLAAVLAGPQVVHQYLIADPANSSISELVLWATPESALDWAAPPDDRVLAALQAALCGAYLSSCG